MRKINLRQLILGISGNAIWWLLYVIGAAVVAHGGLFISHPQMRIVATGVLLAAVISSISFWSGRRQAAIVIQGHR
jgi:uncharacterized membrane protein YoaK (UPF0700 family)